MQQSPEDPAQQWDQRYREAPRLWSGSVNAALAKLVGQLHPGTALDLGCGEGADVVWLAEQGWQTTGVDISSVAIQRAEDAARTRGISEQQARFEVGDVTKWRSPERYDLVVAAFLHSHGVFDRKAALATAKDHVANDGNLVIISHATFPPWAKTQHDDTDHEHPGHESATPETELELLELDPAHWTVEVAQIQSRQATGPEGQQAELDDTVIMVRRASAT